MELAKLETQLLDKKILRKNLDAFRKSPVNEPPPPQGETGDAGTKGKIPTRKY